jgi:DNA uptake protein ComE-like DNA-binding protein
MPARQDRPALERRRSNRWAFISLLPFGLGAWAPILGGVQHARRSWIVWGTIWTLVAVAAWVLLAIFPNGNGGGNSAAGGMLILAWVGPAATSFALRAGDRDPDALTNLERAEAAGRIALRDRAHAREIAVHNPSLALEIGIGRPDREGATDGGVVDLNNAAPSILTTLPGVDEALATQIVEARGRVDGFSSVEDMGAVMNLDAPVVERLRERAVFLPRIG